MSAEEIEEERIEENALENAEDNADEIEVEKPEEKKKNVRTETVIITDMPKVRLITAFVMLSGSGFMAIFTLLQHYEIGAWIRTLLISLVVFFIVGRLFEYLVTHFDDLNKAKEKAILAQEEAIAQRKADELEAQKAAKARRLAEEEAAALQAEETVNQSIPDNDYLFGESDDFEVGDDLSEF